MNMYIFSLRFPWKSWLRLFYPSHQPRYEATYQGLLTANHFKFRLYYKSISRTVSCKLLHSAAFFFVLANNAILIPHLLYSKGEVVDPKNSLVCLAVPTLPLGQDAIISTNTTYAYLRLRWIRQEGQALFGIDFRDNANFRSLIEQEIDYTPYNICIE